MNPIKNPNRQKSGVSPPNSAILKSPNTNCYNISTPEVDNNSDGANPLIHQCHMHRNKPLSIKESELQLKKKGVIKNGN